MELASFVQDCTGTFSVMGTCLIENISIGSSDASMAGWRIVCECVSWPCGGEVQCKKLLLDRAHKGAVKTIHSL